MFIVNIMLNLQIKYAQHSAQAQYLQQFNLIDEEEVQRQSLFDQCYDLQYEQPHFIEKQSTQSCSIQTLSFESYVEQMLKINKTKIQNQYIASKIIKTLFVCFGDIVELSYWKKIYANNNKIHHIAKSKLILLLVLLSLFIGFIFYTILTGLMIYFVIKLCQNARIESQVQKSNLQRKLLSNYAIKFKYKYLEQSLSQKQMSKYLKQSIQLLIIQMKQQFQIKTNQNEYVFDELDCLIFDICQQVKNHNFAGKFIQSPTWLEQKINYWQLYHQNQKIQNIIKRFQDIQNCHTVVKESKKQNISYKYKLDQNLFYLILTNKINKERKQVIANQANNKNKLKNLISILERQILLKQTYQLRKKILQTKSYPEQQVAEDNSIPLFTPNQNIGPSYICYEDQTITNYVPNNCKQIKKQLEQLLKNQQIKNQSILQKTKIEQKKMLQKEIQTFDNMKRERISFGIGILPPKRDMSQFYIT